jgi:hypothetical protein
VGKAQRQLDKMQGAREGDAPTTLAARMKQKEAKRWKSRWRQEAAAEAALIGLPEGRMPNRLRWGMGESGMGGRCLLEGVGEGLRKPSIDKEVRGV